MLILHIISLTEQHIMDILSKLPRFLFIKMFANHCCDVALTLVQGGSGWLYITPGQMASILAGDILKCIFLNQNDKIPIQISLKFVPRNPIYNEPALVQIMAWCRIGNKLLSESMMTWWPISLMYICSTRGGGGMNYSTKHFMPQICHNKSGYNHGYSFY